MRRATTSIVMSGVALVTVATIAWGATTVKETEPGKWRIQNDLIRVELDTASGALSVLDKRIDYLWTQPGAAETEVPEIVIPQAAKPPVIDGDLGEWAGEPTFALTPEMVADAREVDGPEDLSAQVRCSWDAAALYLAAAVRDEKAQWVKEGQDSWWEADTIEFWAGGKQMALLLGPEKIGTWSSEGPLAGAQVKMKIVAGGYQVEAALPWEAIGAGGKHQPGMRLRFALGINDADDDTGRQGQLYFPRTWVHSDPSSFAWATLADTEGRVPPLAAAVEEAACRNVTAIAGKPAGVQYETDLKDSNGNMLPATVSLSVPDAAADLIVTIEMPPETPVRRLEGLAPLALPSDKGEILGARYCDGIAVPVTDLSWKGQTWRTYATLDMPWVGLTDGDKGYLMLFETPDDGAARLDQVATEAGALLAPRAYWEGSKGAFAYRRVMSYRFTSRGGHTAICKRYRDYAKQQGLVVTLREKARRLPAVAKLIGAPDFWGVPGLKWCQEAKAAGIDRALVNGRWPAEDMQKMVDMGYLVGEYDNYVDLLEGERGANGTYGPLKEDVRIAADGSMVKGWLTWDKKKQFYKRCSATATEAAKREIPAVLAEYPYNARFLDVTTASGLRECYHPDHPLTRTGDREANTELARYVKSLGLVLGGEHGRWYGAPVYDYWEGMQSGGFYSWPAGHVGKEIPETREDIGERYLTWGLGHEHRVPLWELVFGDCVVSTWYWGDSTGHLYQAAPELADKKDAFNILYGTVPLYWVNRPYGLNWNTLRDRLLASYRNVCKLHEQIGYDEMLSHEFVTADRAVQRTRFSGGTTVTVNFGGTPYTVKAKAGEYSLGQYGFLAEGPEVLEYKALGGGGEVTYIRTSGYLFCDAAGKEHDFGPVVTAGRVTVRTPAADRQTLRLNCEGGPAQIRLSQVQVGIPTEPAKCRLFVLDELGERSGYEQMALRDGVLTVKPRAERLELAWGKAIAAPDLELAERGIELATAEVQQGQPLQVKVRVTNRGAAPARGATIALSIGDRLVGKQKTTVPSLGSAAAQFTVDTGRLDGSRRLTARVSVPGRQLLTLNDEASTEVFIQPNLDAWSKRRAVTVTNNEVSRSDAVVSADVDFGEAGVDPASVRVVEGAGAEPRLVPAQFEPDAGGDAGQVWWIMPGETPAGQQRRFSILYDARELAGRHEPPDAEMWDADTESVTTPAYRAKLSQGTIAEVYDFLGDAPDKSIFVGIVVSSGDTGWVHEQGEVTDLRLLSQGPVRTVVEVDKALAKGYSYTKRYEFYPTYFIVRTTCEPKIGSLTRAYYGLPCKYEDDKGNTAQIDGKGDAEGVSGKDPNPKWYVAYADGWAHSCLNLSDASNVTYWDGGAWGGVGLNVGGSGIGEVAYVFHGGQQEASFAERDYALLTSSPAVVVGE